MDDFGMTSLPPVQFPLFGNSLVVGLFSLLHIAVAGLSVGFMALAPVFEWRGRANPAALDLAHSLTRFTIIIFSASTVLAVLMVELLIGLFPVTTMWMWNQFRGPIGLGIAAFVLQLLALYPYYHFWDRIIRTHPWIHVALGIAAFVFMLIWVLVLDGMGSYMLTPVEGGTSWVNMINPTWLPLALHRLMGDIIIAGYTIGAYGTWRVFRPADQSHRDYYTYLARVGWITGFIALLLQPFSGLLYAWLIQTSVPDAYEQLVRGPYQGLVYLQFFFIALLFIGNHLVLRSMTPYGRRSRWLDAAFVAVAAALVASVGNTIIRRALLYGLIVLAIWSLWKVWRNDQTVDIGQDTHMRPLMISLGVVAVLTYLTMGTIRETARHPDTVRHMISLQDEARYPAAHRHSRAKAAEQSDHLAEGKN